MLKSLLLVLSLTLLFSCIPVSPFLLPPSGIERGDTDDSVKNQLGGPHQVIQKGGNQYYLYKHTKVVSMSQSRNFHDDFYWVIEFDSNGKVTEIETFQGTFFGSYSRNRAQRWIESRARKNKNQPE